MKGVTCFPIKRTYDEDGVELPRDDDEWRFKCARDGDHLTTPFQCDLCHFRNIQGRDPLAHSDKDCLLLEFIRRANLDAFWARETNSVKANSQVAKRAFKPETKFGFRHLFPPMGPFPLMDTFGMKLAVTVLDRSLDKGKHEAFVQWATFRKIRSTFTNVWQASLFGSKDVVGAYERKKTWISSSPSHQFFYNRFMVGCHKRVGELVKRDEPITVPQLKAIDLLLSNR